MLEVGTPILYVDVDLVFNAYPEIFTAKQTHNVDFMSVNWMVDRYQDKTSTICTKCLNLCSRSHIKWNSVF